jgi:hypothetical protein
VMTLQPELEGLIELMNRAQVRTPCRRMNQRWDVVAVEAVADVADGDVTDAVEAAAGVAAVEICTVG